MGIAGRVPIGGTTTAHGVWTAVEGREVVLDGIHAGGAFINLLCGNDLSKRWQMLAKIGLVVRFPS